MSITRVFQCKKFTPVIKKKKLKKRFKSKHFVILYITKKFLKFN